MLLRLSPGTDPCSRLNLIPLLTPLSSIQTGDWRQFPRVPLPVFEAVILSKGKFIHCICPIRGQSTCFGDHISQNALTAPGTTIPRIPLASSPHSSQHAVSRETTKGTAILPRAQVWSYSLLAAPVVSAPLS